MRPLLDTHAFLWFILDDPQLSAPAKAVDRKFAQRRRRQSGELLGNRDQDRPGEILVPLTVSAVYRISDRLERFPHSAHSAEAHERVDHNCSHHHKDPFDRMLVVQALVENIPIISPDAPLDVYGVKRFW